MTTFTSPPALRLVRLPGEFGPIVRCSGELTVATSEALRRELALLEPLGHAALTVNLSGCGSLDADGILTLLHAFKRLHGKGQRLAVVAGTERIARLLQFVGIDTIIPTFPTEAAVALALRGAGPPAPAPENWEEARSRTLARWQAIQTALEAKPAEETLHPMTSMMALCERAEQLFQERPVPTGARCQLCPLFYTLGGQTENVGCQSVLGPLVEAVRAGRTEAARAQVAAFIRILEEMPLPEEASPKSAESSDERGSA